MVNPQLRLAILAFPMTSYLIVGRFLLTLIDLSSYGCANLWNFAVGDRPIYDRCLKNDRGLVLAFPVAVPILAIFALISFLGCSILAGLKLLQQDSTLEQVQKWFDDEPLWAIALPAKWVMGAQGIANDLFDLLENREVALEDEEPLEPAADAIAERDSVQETLAPEMPETPSAGEEEPAPPLTDNLPEKMSDIETLLYSESGMNYERLRDRLADGDWQKANEETVNVLLQGTRREADGWLDGLNLEELDCAEFVTIDRLWMHYSGGRFGLTLQRGIYEDAGEDYQQFCDRIGWRNGDRWLAQEELDYTENAPSGHLPYLGSAIGYSLLIYKLRSCKMG
ncbi:GUN4 domain-containing protein [Roseofilum casamattae]|uniref:GUN4 domain-containing protein n=1 Tax=Roseofilum casamattae BLCC-M143 TaxID=3022442 RepID=A0ABT7BTP1_9CYAN|nr:GUN4 domain-containing protein [Roseofilum casamattae]MDJ1181894.1 GUN4 domain-containing protein [Roseofilum casamattae BLCC-M143]